LGLDSTGALLAGLGFCEHGSETSGFVNGVQFLTAGTIGIILSELVLHFNNCQLHIFLVAVYVCLSYISSCFVSEA
jgi:hypothetical protein